MQRDQADRERDYDTDNEPAEDILERPETETEFSPEGETGRTSQRTRSKSAGRATGRTASKRAGSKTSTARAGQRSASTRGKRPQRPSRAGR